MLCNNWPEEHATALQTVAECNEILVQGNWKGAAGDQDSPARVSGDPVIVTIHMEKNKKRNPH